MDSLLDVVRRTAAFFEKKGVDSPRLTAELLFAQQLGLRRLDLYLQFERPLTALELDALRPLVARRAKREPLQHILGETEFFTLSLKCDSRALIPRPETEELVDRLVQRLAHTPPARVLDLGTGSGAIALALAMALPEAEVTATDSSAEALSLARENLASAAEQRPEKNLPARVELLNSDWFSAVAGRSFDLVVSNPPYLTEAEMETAEPEVVRFEPAGALVSGPNGLDALREIVREAPVFLAPGGLLALETGIAQHEALAKFSEEAGFAKCWGEKDLSRRPRYFFAQR